MNVNENSLFTPEVIAAVARHMNEDHAADSLLIVRALGGRPGAEAAEMTGMSAAGIRFAAHGPDGVAKVDVPWSAPITSRGEVRTEVVRMYEQACAALGVEPRGVEAGDTSHA
jgi:hypothetical protein